MSLPKRLEAIPCKEVHDDSQKLAENGAGPACKPNRLGDPKVEELLLDPTVSRRGVTVLEGYLLGIGEASRNEVDTDARPETGASNESSCESESAPSWAGRRLRGRRVAELFLDVAVGCSTFMASEARAADS